MSDVAVIIPNYNGKQFLEGCLSSLYERPQGDVDFEVVVVDNASSDGSVEFMKEFYPQIKLFELHQNTGFCHAVNLGIENTDSPYVLLLNNDTKVLDNFVGNLYRSIIAKEKAFSVGARMLMWDKPELIDDAGDRYCVLGWAFGRGKGKPAGQYDKPCRVFSACGGAAIYSRKILNEIGLFDEVHFAYLEDLDIGYRANINGYYNYYEPTAEVIHFGSASTGSKYNPYKAKQVAANSLYVIWKNMPVLQIILNLPFLMLGFLVKYIFYCRKKYGKFYRAGLKVGWKHCLNPGNRSKKVVFQWKNFFHYLSIQLRLYWNCIRFLKKS